MPNLMEIAFGSVEQARQDIHDSEMRTIRMKHENNALERSLNTFAQLKAKYDELSDSYDYVEADRTAARQILKEVREAAGISKEVVKDRVIQRRAEILQQAGLSRLMDKY